MSFSPFSLGTISIFLIAGLAGCATGPSLPQKADSEPSSTKSAPQYVAEAPQQIGGDRSSLPAEKSVNTVLSLVAVGDVMLGTDFPDDRLAPEDGANLLKSVLPNLQQADITFGNLEGVLLDGGEAEKRCRNPLTCFVFRMPERYAIHLKQAGFDVLSLANNHARDFGEAGRQRSMAVLDSVGIRHSGLEGDIARWEVRGTKVVMIAFSPFRGSHNMLNLEQAQQFIQRLARDSSVVIVSMHAGAEGADATKTPFATEYFHGEERGDEVAFARAVIDAGADLVLGHGPHVPRALELYKGRLIAYSLGNFCTYIGVNVNGINGLAPILDVNLSPEGEFLAGKIVSTRQVRPGGPQPDPTHAAARLMSKLTEQDFPDGLLTISPTGEIQRKASR